MPLESFFDLVSPVDIQRAAAEAMPAQLAARRAVLPAVSLRGAFQAALQRQRLGQELVSGERRLGLRERELGLGERRLGIEQRRIGLAEQQGDYEAGQLPFEIGTGVVSGATRLYGGYRALQEQENNAAFRKEYLDRLTTIGRQGTENAVSLQAALRQLQSVHTGTGYLPPQQAFERYGP